MFAELDPTLQLALKALKLPFSTEAKTELNVEYRVAMLGATGTGKTTMIAALYDQFTNIIDPASSLTLTPPDPKTSRQLNRIVGQLKRAIVGASGATVDPRSIQPSTSKESYCLNLEHANCVARLGIVFDDYPGSWVIYNELNPTYSKAVQDIVKNARVILVAIDTPSLMELPVDEYDLRHVPNEISDFIQRAIKAVAADSHKEIKQVGPDFLVLFVAMKCERWARSEKERRELYKKFRSAYHKVWRVLESANVSTGFLPIQTLGSVEFSHFEPRRDEATGEMDWEANYRICSNLGFAPVDCEQPLRYVLGHLFGNLAREADAHKIDVSARIGERTRLKRASFWFKNLVGMDYQRNELSDWTVKASALLDEATSFSINRKSSGVDGFYYFAPQEARS